MVEKAARSAMDERERIAATGVRQATQRCRSTSLAVPPRSSVNQRQPWWLWAAEHIVGVSGIFT
jgi:hypothetical protein